MKRLFTLFLAVSTAALACKKAAPNERLAPPANRLAPAANRLAPAALSLSGVTPLGPVLAARALGGEARRGLASPLDPALAKHQNELERHFGAPIPNPLAFQVASIASDRVAVLLQATLGPPRPLVWLLDANGDLVWSKQHPMGGVNPGATEPVILSAPEGHVCLAWCNGSTSSVALRRWAEDGSPFADYDALRVDACDALSGLYWPRRGWVLAVARAGSATLELIDESGGHAWGNDGLVLPWASWNGAATISLVLDTKDSLMLARFGRAGGDGSAEYVFASRWSPDGRPMWPGPLSVKRLPGRVRDPRGRVVLEPAADGRVRVTVPKAALAASESMTVEVASDGTVTSR